jgi:hypothetical protein
MTGKKGYMTELAKKLNEIADDILRHVEETEVDACDPKQFYVKFHMGQQYKDMCATEFVEEISRIRGVNLLNSSIKYTPGNPREIVIEVKALNQERMQHLMSRINNWDCIHGSARMWSV